MGGQGQSLHVESEEGGGDGRPGQSTKGCFLMSRRIVALSAESLAESDVMRLGGDLIEQTQKARGQF